MNRPAARRLSQKQFYGPAADKNLRGMLRKELLTNFGFEQMFLMADVLIDRFLAIIQEADVLHGPLEPFQTVVYGYDKRKKFEFVTRPYHLHLRPARVTIVSAEELSQLCEGVSLPYLRGEMAVRILREAYAQDAILSFTDVALVLCQAPPRISQLVRGYKKVHPDEFIPHCGSVLDMGSTQTHKWEAILLYLQGHLTSEIARQIQHAPEDVDRYICDYQRVIELAEEDKPASQISFVTGLSPRLVREHITLWREMKALKETEAASANLDKEKEKDASAEQR
jgi:hypothetical protein